MRLLALPVAALALIGSAEPADTGEASPLTTSPQAAPIPGLTTPDQYARILELRGEGENCRDRIMQVREDMGLPPLMERQPASPDNPHLIYAVDRRQDGCSVMVMMGNRNDIRPLPEAAEGPIRMIPAEDSATPE